jgi:hypothetical protein
MPADEKDRHVAAALISSPVFPHPSAKRSIERLHGLGPRSEAFFFPYKLTLLESLGAKPGSPVDVPNYDPTVLEPLGDVGVEILDADISHHISFDGQFDH